MIASSDASIPGNVNGKVGSCIKVMCAELAAPSQQIDAGIVGTSDSSSLLSLKPFYNANLRREGFATFLKPSFGNKKVYVYRADCNPEAAANQEQPSDLCLNTTIRPKKSRTLNCNHDQCSTHREEQWSMYEAEWLVPRLVLASPFVTNDPAEADLFLVPNDSFQLFHECPQRKECSQHAADYLLELHARLILSPWWHRRRGADHIMVWPQGEGAHKFMRGSFYFGNATFLTNQGSRCQDGRPAYTHVPGRDVVLPYTVPQVQTPLVTMAVLPHTKLGSPRQEDFLFIFRGTVWKDAGYSSCVRQLLLALYGGSKARPVHPGFVEGGANGSVIVAVAANEETYTNEMLRSRFCLSPEGWSPWNPRPMRALALGCIPVVLSDSLQLPGEAWLPWEKFSVRFSPAKLRADPLSLEKTLRFIPDIAVQKMRMHMSVAAESLLWYRNPLGVLDWVLEEAHMAAMRTRTTGYVRPVSLQGSALGSVPRCPKTEHSDCALEFAVVAKVHNASASRRLVVR